MSTPYCVAFITTPVGKKAASIADQILKARLGACVNISPVVQSFYWWNGKREQSKEALLIVKTRKSSLTKLIALVRRIHPYEVPEIIALPIEAGNRPYLKWLHDETC